MPSFRSKERPQGIHLVTLDWRRLVKIISESPYHAMYIRITNVESKI